MYPLMNFLLKNKSPLGISQGAFFISNKHLKHINEYTINTYFTIRD